MAVTVIIFLCIFVFAAQLFAGDGGSALIDHFGFVPSKLFSGNLLSVTPENVPLGATLVTYTFLHGSWMHLLGNMLYLWIFADNVEDATGHPQFIVFFLVTSAVGAVAHGWPDSRSIVPIIGASGGVSGVLGAYLLLHPKAEISIAVPIFLVVEIVSLPAWVVLAAWFVLNFVLDMLAGNAAGIAFRAHIGGFIAGIVLIPFLVPALRTALRARLSI